jgi:hypothetical protein
MSSEKIEAFWQDATAGDVARVMAGETVEARFRDHETRDWQLGELTGFSLKACRGQWQAYPYYFCECQAYREPSWYTERPDPGPGWRLLDKFPGEELKPGDEYFDRPTGRWHLSGHAKTQQQQLAETWYRRRIEPVEPKFAVGQTVKVVGPKQIPALEWSSVGMAQYAGTTQTIDRVELLTNPPGTYYHLKGVINWCFREDYLEAVEPAEHYLGKAEAIKQFIVGDTFRHPSGLRLTITAKGFEVTQ